MKKTFFAVFLLATILNPVFAGAATTTSKTTTAKATTKATVKPFTYSGWIPYWKSEEGVANTLGQLPNFKEITPFIFEVDPVTGVTDKGGMDTDSWKSLMAAAKADNVKVIPSILWLSRSEIYDTMSDPVKRRIHEEDILGTILIHDFAGIEVDYENKSVETKPYFSKFIKELGTLLHSKKKLLYCTVEPRTPMDSRFPQPRPPVEYANDYAVLNKYCDEVRVMAYDQGNIDLKLNAKKGANAPYLPVADPDWVAKVIQETRKSISASKLVLGIPTYGYEYELVNGEWKRVRAVNYDQVMAMSSSTGILPVRNSAGELSFARVATSSAYTDAPLSLRLASVSDSFSVAQKIALAKKYGLKGVVLFKFDGGLDQKIWDLFKK